MAKETKPKGKMQMNDKRVARIRWFTKNKTNETNRKQKQRSLKYDFYDFFFVNR